MGRNAKKRREIRLAEKLVKKVGIEEKNTASAESPSRPAALHPGAPSYQAEASVKGIFEHIKGKIVISFLQEILDCCSEKCILEYTPLFNKDNIAVLMVPRPSYTDVLKYLSQVVVYFRAGHKEEADVSSTRQLLQYMTYLQGLGIRQVYYIDDFLFLANRKSPLAILSACNAIIVANSVLKDYLVNTIRTPQPIIVVPTHVNLPTFDSVPPLSDLTSRRFKVLLSSQGRIGINHLYEMCEIMNGDSDLCDSIELILSASEVAQIRSVINRFRNIKKHYLDWMPLVTYYRLCKSVDLIIHPARPDDLAYMCPPELQQVWLDSKCEVKYTMSGAAKIPIISSPVYSYKMAIKEGETGFLANTAEEFVEKIRMLKNNPELCKKIGSAARTDIEQNYDIIQRYPLYRDAILGSLDSKANVLVDITKKGSKKFLFVPPGEGGPRSFYENMKKWLPKVSNGVWEATTVVDNATASMAVAFIMADAIIAEKEKHPEMRIIYRLDGLPTHFDGSIDTQNLAAMQRMFRRADIQVWQSKHCLKMWRESNLIPPEVYAGGPIIHNGVDLHTFNSAGEVYIFPQNRKYNFLNLNWSTFQHKRLDLLQETIKKYESNPDIHFYLIGNYMDTNQIHNMNYWKEFKNVTYTGVMKNQTEDAKRILASIYRAATALIFTSEMEGSPNTILEALGCNCPVVYNANSDIVPEILGTNCVPLENLEQLLNDTYRQQIKEEMTKIAPEYSMEGCVRRYLSVLEGL